VDDWHPLFQGDESAAWGLAARLEQRGIASFVRPESAGGARRAASAAFCVLVPPGEGERAEFLLREWRLESAARVSGLAARLRRVLVVSALPPGGWWAGATIAPGALPEPGPVALGVVWAVSVVWIAQVEHRRHAREHVALPAASALPPPAPLDDR
jgi:hypothetical protein